MKKTSKENKEEDKILVKKAQEDDRTSFEKLVKKYSNYVYTTAFFMLRNSHDAEDISQEVFVKVYLSLKGFRGLSSFKTWLRKLTVNTCIDKIRLRSKTKGKKFSLDKMTEDYEIVFKRYAKGLEKDYFTSEKVKEVLRIIVDLDENYRIPLILRDLQDYSYREIAKLTKKPIGTVKTNIYRARKTIKEKLDEK